MTPGNEGAGDPPGQAKKAGSTTETGITDEGLATATDEKGKKENKHHLIITATLALAAGVAVGYLIWNEAEGTKCPGLLSATISNVLTDSYAWTTLEDEAKQAGYDSKGEYGHVLRNPEDGSPSVKADIHRVNGSNKRKEECFTNQVVLIAKVVSPEGPYRSLFIDQGDNYFVAWHEVATNVDQWHGAMLNKSARTEIIPFSYERHWQAKPPPPDIDESAETPDGLAQRYLDCWNFADGKTRRACFAEQKTAPAPVPEVGLGGNFQFYGSQPWVSCSQYGCCCGGQQCHN